MRPLAVAVTLCCVASLCGGCGRKGPPLPPLVLVPAAPAEFSAERRGSAVDLRFGVPSANADGSRPADIERVDVYGYTGAVPVADADVVRRGRVVATIEVKAPRDPDDAVGAAQPDADVEPAVGPGIDQGAFTRAVETLTVDTLRPGRSNVEGRDAAPPPALFPVLLGPPPPAARSYVAVGVSTRGRRGALSRRASVLLTGAPAAPAQPSLAYDATSVTIGWLPADAAAVVAATDVLESRPLGVAPPARTYNVYDVTRATEGEQAPQETRVTETPVADTTFVDTRIELGRERCYVVRVLETIEGLSVESDASPAACRLLADIFPPAPPSGLNSVASSGAVNLIWEPNPEADLAGYLVLRGESASALTPLTPAPIAETRFTDEVAAGRRYYYAVLAVDKAGNRSGVSSTADATAR